MPGNGRKGAFGQRLRKIKKIKLLANLTKNESIVSPQKVNTSTVHSDDEPFFGFSPQKETPFERKPGSIASIDSPFLGFTPENQQSCESMSVDVLPNPTFGIYGSMIPTSADLGKPEETANIHNDGKSNSLVVNGKSFFKIVLGDFCQFSPMFPQPHNQCTAMAAAALAFNSLKPIVEWKATDLNEILYSGQTYYEECLTNFRFTHPSDTTTFLEAINLNENLSIASQDMHVFVNMHECRGGAYESRDVMSEALTNFEMNSFNNAILTYKGYSYGLFRYRSSYSNKYFYIFFDSHGRDENGEKVVPVTGYEGRSAILFFENADTFINFFTQEWKFLSPASHAENRNFILVPLHFLKHTQEETAVPSLLRDRTQTEFRDPNVDVKFHIVCGTFCEYDLKAAAHAQHQCSGIVIFSFLYSTIHSIMSWDANNLCDILEFGNMFYQKRYADETERNSQYDPMTILNPGQFAGYCTYENITYKIHVRELEFSGGMNKEDIADGFRYLKELEIPFGLFTVNDLSYGLIVCRSKDFHCYIFFDSHGRTNTGEPYGPYSAVLYFDEEEKIIEFIYIQFRGSGGYSLHPIQFSVEPCPPNTTEEPLLQIVSSSHIEQPSNYKDHSHCIALSMCAIFYAYRYGIENWNESTLDDIFSMGTGYHDHCNEIIADNKIPRIRDYIRDISADGSDYIFSFEQYGFDHLIKFESSMNRFYFSTEYSFAFLTICELTYAVCKFTDCGKILFYDVHGRNKDGTFGGNLAVAIYFNTLAQFYTFIYEGNEDMFLFTLECIKITPVTDNTVPRVISGTFAQNDVRFKERSRNTQCSANSVVFLAFAFVVKEQLRSVDVDAILELGDHIYTASYSEAIKLRPRNHSYLAAHEIKQNIFVNVNRLNVGVVNVQCKPLIDKEYSGNFGQFARTYIERFFHNYSDGVFICCSLAIALHKIRDKYMIFDPHARTPEGVWHYSGKANIFIFKDIPSLFEFMCRFGYNSISEFTLTPFNISTVANELCNQLRNVCPPVRQFVETIVMSQDVIDDIPIADSPDWNESDNIPLIEVKRLALKNEENCSQESLPTSVKSMPHINRKTKAERYRDRLRNKTQYKVRKTMKQQLSDIEVRLRRRWEAYSRKCLRTNAPNAFGKFENFIKYCEDFHAESDSDEALIRAADAAVEECSRAEQMRQLRMQNNALIPTHFQAFGNHEDIDESDGMYALHKLSPMNKTCTHCGALYFDEECNSRKIFTKCCNSGEIHSELPQQQSDTYPQFLRNLLLNQSPMSQHFMNNIMLFNNVLSFASLGTTNVHHIHARGSLGPVVTMEGMIYHIAEHFHTNSTGVNMPTAQLYYIDNNTAVSERMSRVSGVTLNRGLLQQLENFMRANNPLAAAYRMLKDVLNEVRSRPNAPNVDVHMQIVRNRDQIRIRQNHGGDFGMPTSNEVAIVYTHLPSGDTKNIIVFPVTNTPEAGIALKSHDPNRDAMMYPILFPYSEQTWTYTLMRRKKVVNTVQPLIGDNQSESDNEDNEYDYDDVNEPEDDVTKSRRTRPRKRITVREFYSYILRPRATFSPLLNAGKLTQQFTIDAYSRAQDNTFEYLESDKGQAQIRSETYGALKDYIDRKKVFQPDIPGKLIVMPNSIVGSPQYMKDRYQDTLAIVAKYGKPTFFITFTCNPMWDDIRNNIPKGANAIDHPGIVARVFKAKMDELMNDITKKHVLGKCVAFVGVVEWQKRTLPHLHLVTFNTPEDRPANHIDIDKFVSAEIPDRIKSPRLYQAVTTYMYHHRCDDTIRKEGCRVPRNGIFFCPRHPKLGEVEDKDKTKKCVCHECSKHFPHKFSDKSELIENSYPIYRRRCNGRKFISSKGQEIDNQWIVPYNPYLILKYNCHVNVEITSSLKTIKYLFKYLHKGVDMARLNITVVDNVQIYNEFENFIDCRYLSAGESIWKLYGFPMLFKSATIYSLPVHLQNYQNVIFDPANPAAALEHADTHLTAYFKLNTVDPRARQYLYTEIPLHYVYLKKPKEWRERQRGKQSTLSRMYMVNYNNVELHSLRLLLLTVRGAQSFEDIRTVNGIQYNTFRQAATELGLLDDDSLHIRTFEEIVGAEMPHRIRSLFANMLLFSTPTDPAGLWNMFKSYMYEDFIRKHCCEDLAINLALRHISYVLNAAGKTNTEYLLPEPIIAPSDAEKAKTITGEFDTDGINEAEAAIEGQRLAQMLNAEQRVIFDEIIDSAQNVNDAKKHRLFFVDGPGGTGKTFLFSTIISTLNGYGLSVLPIAWTGIAASLMKGGRTVHSTFKLPLDMYGRVACHLSTTSNLAIKLRAAAVIVWDEISMSLCYALDAVDKFFQDLMGNNLPFGGKIFAATGDFRQILPVVKGGTKYDLLNVCAKNSNVWPLLQRRALRTNVRLTDPDDIEFGQQLLDIGEGKVNDYPVNEYYNSYVKLPSECIEPNSIVDRIYSKSFSSSDVEHYSKCVILSTLNEDVDFLNKEIYSRLTEEVSTEQTYYSSDSVIGLDPNDDDAYDTALLNTLTPPNLAPHELKLKENCIVMLLFNLNPAEGLCNGTRLIVTKLYKTCIRARILGGAHKGREVLISRCHMSANSPEISGKLLRTQIPVKLAFALTINKAQGQTFDYVGIYLRKPPFAHGQLYVALSRVRSKAKLMIQVLPDIFMGKLKPGCDDIFVPNIVYKEIF